MLIGNEYIRPLGIPDEAREYMVNGCAPPELALRANRTVRFHGK